MEKMDNEIIPKVLENVSQLLDQKDRLTTIETAKNTIFKTYQAAHGVRDNPVTMLALKIETSPSTESSKVFTGEVVGKPQSLPLSCVA